tara:strand:+ start:43 stop:654 length:612 start_codon:yes stop_codon:yes gene_type:complete
MTHVSIIRIIFIFFFLTASFAHSNNDKTNRIEVLVNENIITKYDIVQRLKINSILNRVEITDINYNQLLNIVIDDLVIEKLKIRKIEEYNISFNKNEFITHEKRYLLNLNFSKKELEELFYINDINYNHLNDLLGIDLKWQKLIYGLYFRVTSVTEQEISELTSKNPNIDEETANDLILQKQLDLKSKKLIKDLRDEATIEYK